MNAHEVTKQFEKMLCEYTGAPYAVTTISCSAALFLAMMRKGVKGKKIAIPERTYPSVPCEIINAGGLVEWMPVEGRTLKGAYQLGDTGIWDCALRFTSGMYVSGQTQCVSFTGPRKILQLTRGGAILTDNKEDYEWFKKARYSGREEVDALQQENFDMIGWAFYMPHVIASIGVMNLQCFPRHNEDREVEYPKLSDHKVYTDANNQG